MLSDPVKAMVFDTVMDPGVTESMVTLQSVFSKLKMLLCRVVTNCSQHEHRELRTLSSANSLELINHEHTLVLSTSLKSATVPYELNVAVDLTPGTVALVE